VRGSSAWSRWAIGGQQSAANAVEDEVLNDIEAVGLVGEVRLEAGHRGDADDVLDAKHQSSSQVTSGWDKRDPG